MIQGVSNSTMLNAEIKPQSHDLIHVNDFLHKELGNKSDPQNCQFKVFFAVQDPLLTVPPSKQFPNFKVDYFFKWIKYISVQACNPGKNW